MMLQTLAAFVPSLLLVFPDDLTFGPFWGSVLSTVSGALTAAISFGIVRHGAPCSTARPTHPRGLVRRELLRRRANEDEVLALPSRLHRRRGARLLRLRIRRRARPGKSISSSQPSKSSSPV